MNSPIAQYSKTRAYSIRVVLAFTVLAGTVSCSLIKGTQIGITHLTQLTNLTHVEPYRVYSLTPGRAKEQVYTIAHEIINAIPEKIANMEEIDFDYAPISDDGSPPFRAVVTIDMNTNSKYQNTHIIDTYKSLLLKLPGYSDNTGDYHSHLPVITKGDVHIYLPNTTWRAIEINGPVAIYDDLRKVPEHQDKELIMHGPLIPEDVTENFRDNINHHKTLKRLTSEQAKKQVYTIAHEIIDAIPEKIAYVNEINFFYTSDHKDKSPPFKAVMDIFMRIKPEYINEKIADTYINIFLKLPGYNYRTGKHHSYTPFIAKGGVHIYPPSTIWGPFEIRIAGPAAVYKDLRKVSEHQDEGVDGEMHSTLIPRDVTKDFHDNINHHKTP